MTVLAEYFTLFKVIHLLGAFAWMAGLFYLPRLFVYHADAVAGSELAETFKVMERRLLRGIMNPAMIVTLVFGALAVAGSGTAAHAPWLWIKLVAVAGLLALHMLLANWRRGFEADANARPAGFYRWVNEVPTILLIVIVVMAVGKPFAVS